MSEQSVLIAIVAVLAVFGLWLLFRGRLTDKDPRPASSVPSEELSELELDRAMGRISEADYARFRRELDTVTESAAPPDAPPAHDAVDVTRERAELLVRQWSAANRPVCATCGERPEPGARYCSTCGAHLAPDREA
jgi:hypothetical protein